MLTQSRNTKIFLKDWRASVLQYVGVGKIFKIGSQGMNAQAACYYNLEKPDITGDWSIRLQLQFMFPK